MRVTENTNFESIRNSINRSKSRMEGLQNRYATLKKINTPSDDPVGSAKILEVRTERVNIDQYQNNAKSAEMYLNLTELALQEMSDLVSRAKEIALSQSSQASSNDDTRRGIAEEVKQIYNQAVSAANRRVGEKYLFGGYKTHSAPIDPEGNYQGDDGQIMIEIGKDVFIPSNITALEAFNTNPLHATKEHLEKNNPQNENREKDGDSSPAIKDQFRGLASESESARSNSPNTNLFEELQKFHIFLLNGDVDGIRDTLESFDQLHSNLVAMRSRIGSRLQGLQNMAQTLERQNISQSQLTSSLEDADMAQVVSDLAKEETIYRSALQSSQKLVQPTLMDFLR